MSAFSLRLAFLAAFLPLLGDRLVGHRQHDPLDGLFVGLLHRLVADAFTERESGEAASVHRLRILRLRIPPGIVVTVLQGHQPQLIG